MSENKFFSILIKALYLALFLAGLWLFFRFLLPWFLPFIIALLVAGFIEPFVKKLMEKFKIPRFVASGISTILVLGVIFGLAALIMSRVIKEIAALLKQIPAFLSALPDWGTGLQSATNKMIAAAPIEMQEFLSASVSKIISEGISVPTVIYEKLISFISAAAGALPAFVLFIVAFGLGIYFTSSEYPSVAAFIMRQFPLRWRTRVLETKDKLKSTMGKWMKAQIMLMFITFIELSIGFSIMGINFFILLAALVAIIDTLPVFGTGTILVPWALWSLINQDYKTAITLMIIYCVISIVRSFMEPKLVGKQLGLSPIVSLVCIYVGYSAAGFIGIILAPIILMMVKQFNDLGYIKIFK